MTATGDWVTSYVYDGATAGPVGEIYTKNAGATASALGIWDNTGQLIFERDKWRTWATDVIQREVAERHDLSVIIILQSTNSRRRH